MANQLKLLVGSSALAVMLAACGGGGGSDPVTNLTPTANERPSTEETTQIIDEQNEFTDEVCPETSAEAGEGEALDSDECLEEGEENTEEDTGFELSQDLIVQQFCPDASSAFDIEGVFDPAMLQEDPQGAVTGGLEQSGTFLAACLQEAAGNLQNLGDLIGGSNPITDAICPEESAKETVDPASCFAEAVSEGGLPGGDGGGGLPGADLLVEQLCPEAGAGELSPELPINCLMEAGGNFGDVQELLLGSNPLTEQLCPDASAVSPIDPVACFMEAAEGAAPGEGGTPLDPVIGQFCPDAAAGGIAEIDPAACLAEAGGNFGDVQELLLGANPLTEQLCPAAAADSPIDPAACFMEAAEGLAPGEGGTPLDPVIGQFCPDAAAGGVDQIDPAACLTEAGGNFGDVQDLLLGSNPLTEQLCPEASAESPIDPAACFMEAAEGLAPDGGGLPGTDGNP
ncbi:MAG: hypothetical protein ABNH18_07335, partial [Alcanivorax sp.]